MSHATLPRLVLVALSLLVASALCSRGLASLTADKLFGDGMVLQRLQPLNVWGTGSPGATVSVKLLDGSTTLASAEAPVGDDGRWSATLPPLARTGGPFALTLASGAETLTFSNVLLGDVWLCSGQSNMDFTVKENNHGVAFTALTPANDDFIRHFSVEHLHASNPQETLGDRSDETGNRWQITAAPAVDGFTATGFFFARNYRAANPGVPIGIIKAAWGSTLIESWLSAEVQASRPDLAERAALIAADPANDPLALGTRQRQPAVCYNGMIHPLRRFAIRGFLWYQGESNANAAAVVTYPITQRLLIQSWRDLWGGSPRPWITVQLPGFAHVGEPIYWPWLRDAQKATLAEPDTALLTSIDLGSTLADIGNPDLELHPRTKVALGRRLAALVRARFDGAMDLIAEGPAPLGATLAAPGTLRVAFDLKGSAALTTPGGVAPAGFEVAGDDGVYFPAGAVLEHDAVRLSSGAVPSPRYVRYAMSNLFTGNLYNAETPPLPVAPFRLEPPLLGPIRLEATASDAPGHASLKWDLPVGATRFEVKRASQAAGPFATLATTLRTAYTDNTVAPGTLYYYRITAANDDGHASSSRDLLTAPALILDESAPVGVTRTGAWTASSGTPGAYLHAYLHDGNTGASGGKSVRYTPTLPAPARYHVYGRWTSAGNRATQAPVDITFAQGTAGLTINQTTGGARWNLLGTFAFDPGSAGSLLLRNTDADGFVIADATQWVLAGPAPADGAGHVTEIEGDYTLPPGAVLTAQLGPTASDQIRVAGSASRVTLQGGLVLSVTDGTTPGTTFTLVEHLGSAAIIGIFSGKPPGRPFRSGGRYWMIDYTGGDGNDVVVTLLSARQAWRFTHFGTCDDSGDSADVADPDGDGESNLLEFATAQDPGARATHRLELSADGSAWAVNYTRSRDALADGLAFAIERSPSLLPGTWTGEGVGETIASEDAIAQRVHASFAPDGGSRLFVRLRVTVR